MSTGTCTPEVEERGATLEKQYLEHRSRKMLQAVHAMAAIFDRWLGDSDEEVAEFGGNEHRTTNAYTPPPPEFWTSIVTLVSVWAKGAIPSQLMQLLGPVTFLATEACEHLSRHPRDPHRIPPLSRLFEACNLIIAAEKVIRQPVRALESVADLLAQNVSHQQISLMHGLSVEQVQQEEKEPGSICTADYVPPKLKKERHGDAINWPTGIVLSAAVNKLEEIAKFGP